MRIHIDEDMAAGILVSLLQKAGQDVETPAGAAHWVVRTPYSFPLPSTKVVFV